MRSTSRVLGVSINSVTKLLVEAGQACEAHHERVVRGVRMRRVECDEIWSFAYVKTRNLPKATSAPEGAGSVWTWTALDPDNKLLVSWLVGDRTQDCAHEFMYDLRSRVAGRVQITTDGLTAYRTAVESAFGSDADFAQIMKVFVPGAKNQVDVISEVVSGSPDRGFISTSLVERMNLNMRMGVRRFTRRTNAFSKRVENHRHALALYFTWYNFVRQHTTIGTTPAVRAGLAERPRNMEWILEMVEERRPARAAYRQRRTLKGVDSHINRL